MVGVCLPLTPASIIHTTSRTPLPSTDSPFRAPGLKFGFEGQNVAITFGEHTSQGVLIAYRVAGLDWQFTNITAGATHHLVSPNTPGLSATLPNQLPLTFELRVTVRKPILSFCEGQCQLSLAIVSLCNAACTSMA